MSTNQKTIGYGFTSDSDEKLVTKGGGKFGLNQGAAVLKFAYNPNVAKAGEAEREAVEIVVKIGEKEFKEWINPITKVYDGSGQVITDTTSDEYATEYNKQMLQQRGLMTHYLKALGVSEEAQMNALATPVNSFKEYATRLCALIQPGYEKRPVDVFLEYQWKFGKKSDGTEYDVTFPTLPKNMKGGYFIVPAQPGVWTEQKEPDGGLCYVNSNGQKHPIEKSANFMKSEKGTQQTKGTPQGGGHTPNPNGASNPMSTPGNGQATASTWTAPQK